MEKRKNPEKDLRKHSALFFQVGLLTALMLAVCAFEFRTTSVVEPVDIPLYNVLEQPLIPITAHTPQPKPPKPKVVNPIVATVDPEPLPKEIIIIPEPVTNFIPEIIPDFSRICP